jgi:hypothetical protein
MPVAAAGFPDTDVHLVDAGARERLGESGDGRGAVAAALAGEPDRRGPPPYDSVPERADFVRGSGTLSEKKQAPATRGSTALFLRTARHSPVARSSRSCTAEISPDRDGRPHPTRTTSRVRGPCTPSTRSSSMSLVAEGPEIHVDGRAGSSRSRACGTEETTWPGTRTTQM